MSAQHGAGGVATYRVLILGAGCAGMSADARTVRTDDERVLYYDALVYGLGSVADTAAVPGVEDHAYTLSSVQDAAVPAERLARLGSGTVVVGGGGLTGVESAAEIAGRHPKLNVVPLGRAEPGAAMNAKAHRHPRAPPGDGRRRGTARADPLDRTARRPDRRPA